MLTENEVLEMSKMILEFFKHMTTLNTAVIVIIIALLEKIYTPANAFKSRSNKIIIIASLSSLLISLLFSFGALTEIPSHTYIMLVEDSVIQWVSVFNYYGSIYCFIGGVILFAIFSLVNLSKNVTAQA